jgi:hypothetical protein
MKTKPTPGQRQDERGVLLLDCLAYMGLLALILGMAFLAFYRASEHSRDLAWNAADITRVLGAGERWREEVRTADALPTLEQDDGGAVLYLPHASGEIAYAFRDGTVFRRALPNTNWIARLTGVAVSSMNLESRRHVAGWHWDVELEGRQKIARIRPVFSFAAVAAGGKKP